MRYLSPLAPAHGMALSTADSIQPGRQRRQVHALRRRGPGRGPIRARHALHICLRQRPRHDGRAAGPLIPAVLPGERVES
jgi:hypothetical protein